MSVTTTQFLRKPLYVEAVRVTRENFDEVATWCQGEVQQDEIPGKGTGKKYIKVRVHNPKNPRQTKAMVGDWLLYTDRGYKIYTNKAFHTSFDEVQVVDEPIGDDDTVVIGPECFALKNGAVLSWKGVNYVPQGVSSTNGSHPEMIEAAREAEALEEQRGEGLIGEVAESLEEEEQDVEKAA
jgi:hypothetical protein